MCYLFLNGISQAEQIRLIWYSFPSILKCPIVFVNIGLVFLQRHEELLEVILDQICISCPYAWRLCKQSLISRNLTVSRSCRSCDRSVTLSMSSPFLFRSSITLCDNKLNSCYKWRIDSYESWRKILHLTEGVSLLKCRGSVSPLGSSSSRRSETDHQCCWSYLLAGSPGRNWLTCTCS